MTGRLPNQTIHNEANGQALVLAVPQWLSARDFMRLTGMKKTKLMRRIRQGLYNTRHDGGNLFIDYGQWTKDLAAGKLQNL